MTCMPPTKNSAQRKALTNSNAGHIVRSVNRKSPSSTASSNSLDKFFDMSSDVPAGEDSDSEMPTTEPPPSRKTTKKGPSKTTTPSSSTKSSSPRPARRVTAPTSSPRAAPTQKDPLSKLKAKLNKGRQGYRAAVRERADKVLDGRVARPTRVIPSTPFPAGMFPGSDVPKTNKKTVVTRTMEKEQKEFAAAKAAFKKESKGIAPIVGMGARG